MLGKLISYIFICVLLTGCEVENPLVNEYQECESDVIFTFMNVVDENGYYPLEWFDSNVQTFTTLYVETNLQGYNVVNWYSDNCFEYENDCISCVNPTSYTSPNVCDGMDCVPPGTAHQTMAVWEEMIGDTITIYAEFTDWCEIQHIDSLSVVVKNEF